MTDRVCEIKVGVIDDARLSKHPFTVVTIDKWNYFFVVFRLIKLYGINSGWFIVVPGVIL